MHEDSYPYISGSLDAKQRTRRLYLKRLYYGFGAMIIFSSGFLLGLAWYEPEVAQTQTSLPHYRPTEADNPQPVKTLTPPAELAISSLKPQPIPPSEPASHTDLDTDTDKILMETAPPPLSSVMLGSDIAAPPLRQHDQAPVPVRVEAASPPPPLPYLVQIGAFRSEANAHSLVEKLRGKSYQPFIRTVQEGENRALYRVFLDHAQDKAQAQATAKAFEEREKMDALVMLAGNLLLPLPDHREAESR